MKGSVVELPLLLVELPVLGIARKGGEGRMLGMQQKASLVDVAKKARVSISTVSRTINGKGKIGLKTQARVRRVMAELGYKPNRVARRLRAQDGSGGLLGLIIPNVQNPFFADLVRGVEDVAYAKRFGVLLCNYDEDPKKEEFYLEVLQAESVDGVIIPPLNERDAAVMQIARGGTPVVCVDRTLKDFEVDKVEVDSEQGSYEAVKHLIGRGHQRIGIITGPKDSSTGRERLRGYERAHEEAGLTVDERLIAYGDFKEEGGKTGAMGLLTMAERPTALFACNNLMMLGALRVVAKLGFKVPEELAIVGFDDLPMAEVFTPPLTMVSQPAYEVGRCAADLLFKRIEEPEQMKMSIMLKPRLIVRGSA